MLSLSPSKPLRPLAALTISLLIGLFGLTGDDALAAAGDPPARTPTDLVVVTVAAGSDPDAVAAATGHQNLGALDPARGQYLFRALGGPALDGAAATQAAATLAGAPGVTEARAQFGRVRVNRAVERTLTDPLFKAQWHLNNTGQYRGVPGNDARVLAAWNTGVTGAGVTLASVDDGVFGAHPDLAGNFEPDASYDYVSFDADPTPGSSYSHGTAVAGVMAAAADGGACGVGAAFNARLAGLRLPLNTAQTDAQEAAALTHALGQIDIYNSSWGPLDSGTSADMQAPGPLTRAALRRGVTEGRGGLGAIYVWAAGNGRANHDNVNADGYASSIYTVAVAATDNAGRAAWYSEPGAPILVNAPSSGPAGGGIRTTAPASAGCTDEFGGTSSAAPLVAGVVALMLEANPALTWRDVQHILARTAERNDPAHPDWTPNGAGLWVNHDYGFGRVNAAAAVALARDWTTVNPAYTFTAPKRRASAAIPTRAPLSTTVKVTESFPVEHVEVIVNIQHPSRGQLDIALVSPSGTVSTLMAGRARDHGANYRNWRLMSVRHWGEDAAGTWTLRVTDREGDDLSGILKDWTLVIHGSKPPVSGEIARNSGFEVVRKNGLPAAWKAQGARATADRVRVDQAVPRTIAFDGQRSLQLKGARDKNLRLIQNLPTRGLTTGDTLTLSAMLQARDLSAGLELRLLVTYADPALGTQTLAIPAAPGSYPYTLIHDKLTLAGTVETAQLAIVFRATRGTALLDEVSVVAAKAVNAQPAGGPVALPAAGAAGDALRGH